MLASASRQLFVLCQIFCVSKGPVTDGPVCYYIKRFLLVHHSAKTFSVNWEMYKAPTCLRMAQRAPKQGVLTRSQTSPVFLCVGSTSLLKNTVGKGEIARNEQFLLFPQCFLPFWKTLCHFHRIRNCHQYTLSVWKGLKFIVWERVNESYGRILSRKMSLKRQDKFWI